MTDTEILAIFGRAGMRAGLELVARLLDQHAERDVPRPRWREQSDGDLMMHLCSHVDEVLDEGEVHAADHDSGQPTIAHVAARALQLATLAAERVW